LFEIALRASRSCLGRIFGAIFISLCLTLTLSLDAGLVDTASKVIEQLASKLETPRKSADTEECDIERTQESLTAQFLLMRITLVCNPEVFGRHRLKKQAWKQGRPDLAEHFYSQLEAFKSQFCSVRIGELLDLCYEIGNDQLSQRNHSLAVKWLKRGCLLATECGTRIEDLDFLDLRLTLIHTCGGKYSRPRCRRHSCVQQCELF